MKDNTCIRCGEMTSNPKFCSLSCSSSYNSKAYWSRYQENNTKECAQCGDTFYNGDSSVAHCSQSCSARTSNQNRTRKNPEIVCAASGCTVRASYGHRSKVIYTCSSECRFNFQVNEWLEGRESGSNKYSYKPFVKQYLLKTYGERCALCNICDTRPEVVDVLQLDHIDGHWDNNSPGNVRMLCPTCHALTETYGAKNKGQGRTWKSKYNQYAPLGSVDRPEDPVVQ